MNLSKSKDRFTSSFCSIIKVVKGGGKAEEREEQSKDKTILKFQTRIINIFSISPEGSPLNNVQCFLPFDDREK
jgi:hypothetical protein